MPIFSLNIYKYHFDSLIEYRQDQTLIHDVKFSPQPLSSESKINASPADFAATNI